MPDHQPVDARRYRRFPVRTPDQVYAVVARAEGCDAAILSAELLDVSEGGAKLRLEAPPDVAELIELKLGCVEGPFRITLLCRVVWLRQDSPDSWRVGCEFVPKLPLEVMDELFDNIIERRQSDRRVVLRDAFAKWELQPELFGVRLVNVSQGGFCVHSLQSGQVGQRIWLSLRPEEDGTTKVLGSVRWCTSLDDGFLIGCAFLDLSSYVTLCAALEQPETHASLL